MMTKSFGSVHNYPRRWSRKKQPSDSDPQFLVYFCQSQFRKEKLDEVLTKLRVLSVFGARAFLHITSLNMNSDRTKFT